MFTSSSSNQRMDKKGSEHLFHNNSNANTFTPALVQHLTICPLVLTPFLMLTGLKHEYYFTFYRKWWKTGVVWFEQNIRFFCITFTGLWNDINTDAHRAYLLFWAISVRPCLFLVLISASFYSLHAIIWSGAALLIWHAAQAWKAASSRSSAILKPPPPHTHTLSSFPFTQKGPDEDIKMCVRLWCKTALLLWCWCRRWGISAGDMCAVGGLLCLAGFYPADA